MGHELLPLVQDGHDVVGVLVGHPVGGPGLEKYLNLFQVLAFLQEADGVILAPG